MAKAGEMLKSIRQGSNIDSPSRRFEFPKYSPVVSMIKQLKSNEFNLSQLFSIMGKSKMFNYSDFNEAQK